MARLSDWMEIEPWPDWGHSLITPPPGSATDTITYLPMFASSILVVVLLVRYIGILSK